MMTSLSSNPSRHRFSQHIEPWTKSEDTESNINKELSSKMEMINANVVPPINKKLDFDILDGYDEENEGHDKCGRLLTWIPYIWKNSLPRRFELSLDNIPCKT